MVVVVLFFFVVVFQEPVPLLFWPLLCWWVSLGWDAPACIVASLPLLPSPKIAANGENRLGEESVTGVKERWGALLSPCGWEGAFPLRGGAATRVGPSAASGRGGAVRTGGRQGAAVGSGRGCGKGNAPPLSALRKDPQHTAVVSRGCFCMCLAAVPAVWLGEYTEMQRCVPKSKLVSTGREPGLAPYLRAACRRSPVSSVPRRCAAPHRGCAVSPSSPVASGHPASLSKRQKPLGDVLKIKLRVGFPGPLLSHSLPLGRCLLTARSRAPALKAV